MLLPAAARTRVADLAQIPRLDELRRVEGGQPDQEQRGHDQERLARMIVHPEPDVPQSSSADRHAEHDERLLPPGRRRLIVVEMIVLRVVKLRAEDRHIVHRVIPLGQHGLSPSVEEDGVHVMYASCVQTTSDIYDRYSTASIRAASTRTCSEAFTASTVTMFARTRTSGEVPVLVSLCRAGFAQARD